MTMDLHQEELRLEAMARQMGVTRFDEDLTKKVENGRESSTYYGSALLRRSVGPLSEAIKDMLADAKLGVAGRRNHAVKYLSLVEPDVAAYLTSKTILDTLTKPLSTSRIARKIGQLIEDEVRYADFQESAPGLWNKVSKQTKSSQDRHKRTVLMHTYQKHVAHWEGWGERQQLHLGAKLLDLFISSTGLAHIIHTQPQKNKTKMTVEPTQEIVEWLENSRDNASTLSPAYLPMVVRPDPWTGPFSGGYLSPTLRPVSLIKTRNRAYLEELSSLPLQLAGVYEAVNSLQDVSWAVNSEVLQVMTEFWESGTAVAGLPERDELPIPIYPFVDIAREDLSEEQGEVVREWKKKASKLHSHNARIRSRRIQAARIISIAQQFSCYSEMFFPHSLDFRGRAYAVPMFLNPQGPDISKGLLKFSEGKPIGDTTGPGWLAIHGANVFGYDKASLEDRIDWVEENQELILACAEDPFDNRWWLDADSPWCFLAFCFEWRGYIANGADHHTQLPIALDGSCSGLQHFSAALRDPIGGRAVNLTPADTPSDVYQEVADLVVIKLRSILLTSGKGAELAGRILDFGIDRKTTKRSTMTLPYGSTRHSCQTFIRDWMGEEAQKKTAKGEQDPLNERVMEASTLLATLVWESIGEVVIAAREAMGWLRSTARILTKQGLPLVWTTPDGLPLMQEYRDMKARRVKTRFGDKFIYMSLQEEQDNLDARRQANGIAPNWVHSMDATHLRMAVLLAKDNGLGSFAVIHDSFGTHACDTDTLAACLRESMVDLYTADVLEDFRLEVSLFLPTCETIPLKPAFGSLDLNLIRKSDYVFA